MPSCGRPTVCSSTSGGSSGRVPVIDDDSVHAYRTTIGQPSRVRIFSASSGVTGAEPVEHRRSAERSASASCGRSTSFAHCVGTPQPIVACSAHHLLEHRLRRPRGRGEHAVDDELDLVPELVHVARVRERHRHEAHVVVRAEDVAEASRRLQRAVVEPRALGQAGRAARPHDAHGIVGSRGPVDRRTRVPACHAAAHLGARHEHRRDGRVGGDLGVDPFVEQRDRCTSVEDGGDLAGPEARVDAGRDRAQSRARGVRDRVVDARRQRERDHVARRDAARAQLRRQRVGAGEPLAVGEALVAVDVGHRVGLARRDLLEQIAERGARDRRRSSHAPGASVRPDPAVGVDTLGRDRAPGDQPLAVDDAELVEVPTPVVEPGRR